MNRANGFTFIEMLFVLGIISFLFVLSTPIVFNVLDQQQEKQFLNTFEFDVLYAQRLAMQSKSIVRINFSRQQYTILSDEKVVTRRRIPNDWDINLRTMNQLSFDDQGRIREPGTMSIKTPRAEYHVIFPFGKGRGYVVEQ